MIDKIKENISLLILLIAILIGSQLPLDEFVSDKKFESLRIPRLDIPKEIKEISEKTSEEFPKINKSAFLGETFQEKSLTEKPKKLPKLALKAIMIDGHTRIVNINGKIKQRGQWISGYHITRINRSSVLLDGKLGKRIIYLR